MATGKSIVLPYTPASPPNGDQPRDLSRATWDEFYRIAQSLIGLDSPASVSVACSDNVPVLAAITYERLFDEGISFQWESPPGYFVPATGVWTCPQDGLYLLAQTVEVPPWSVAGNRTYIIYLRATIVPLVGAPIVTVGSVGGPDELPLRFVTSYAFPLLRGSQLYFDIALTTTGTPGAVDVKASLAIVRQSGLGGPQ